MRQARESPTQKAVERRAKSKARLEDAQFLNIDLDVRSRLSLTALAEAWPWSYQPLIAEGRPNPRWLILNPRRIVVTAEAAAKELIQHIQGLRGDARLCWIRAHLRMFDIGIRAGGPGRAFEEVRLTTETLRRIAAVGGEIQVTVYPAEPESQFVPPSKLLHRQKKRERQ
jgi:hypothetical protein